MLDLVGLAKAGLTIEHVIELIVKVEKIMANVAEFKADLDAVKDLVGRLVDANKALVAALAAAGAASPVSQEQLDAFDAEVKEVLAAGAEAQG